MLGQQVKNGLRNSLIAFFFVGVCACINEDTSKCPLKTILYLKIVDPVTGEDITEGNDVQYLDLFVFEDGGFFLKKLRVNKRALEQRRPVEIDCPYFEKSLYVAIWGNLGTRETVPEMREEHYIDSSRVSVITKEDGFAICPSDLFYGMLKIDLTDRSDIDEVAVTRKNARMAITVRGLPSGSNPDDYFFKICHTHDGYTFRGVPTSQNHNIREYGHFEKNGDFVSLTPFHLIHSSADTRSVNDYTVLCLCRSDHEEIISVDKDENGDPIILRSGRMTNVLIDLTEQNEIKVSVVITDWDHVYQWVMWE